MARLVAGRYRIDECSVPPAPDGGGDGDRAEPTAPAHVTIFPYLSEQSKRGRAALPGADAAREAARLRAGATLGALVCERLRDVFRGAVVLRPLETADAANFDSDFDRFLEAAWPHLRDVNFLVSHRNFIVNEVCSRFCDLPRDTFLPNGAVVRLVVTDVRTGEQKVIWLIRHCPSDHNVSREGSVRLTACADVAALRRLVPELAAAARAARRSVLYGSSMLPRAILSAVALQRPVGPALRAAVRAAFDQPAAPPEQVEAYLERQSCARAAPGRDAYCRRRTSWPTFRPPRAAVRRL